MPVKTKRIKAKGVWYRVSYDYFFGVKEIIYIEVEHGKKADLKPWMLDYFYKKIKAERVLH